MEYKKLRLIVYPAINLAVTGCKVFEFDTVSELIAAKYSMAELLLFIQDELHAMPDYSNMFVIEILPMIENSEWQECYEDDLKRMS